MTFSESDIDALDEAILNYFLDGRDAGEPWGKATPTEVYRGLAEQGDLGRLNDPAQTTVQHRIKQLSVAGHLENQYDSGCYALVDDPRESE